MATKRSKKKSGSASRPARMDINAVAKQAGVSIATVSRTINHVRTVDPQLAKRVWEAINELNYFPNTQARGLVSGRSRLLAWRYGLSDAGTQQDHR